jgi:hypothetical protein
MYCIFCGRGKVTFVRVKRYLQKWVVRIVVGAKRGN